MREREPREGGRGAKRGRVRVVCPLAEADLHAEGPWWQGSKTPLALQAMWISAIPLHSVCVCVCVCESYCMCVCACVFACVRVLVCILL